MIPLRILAMRLSESSSGFLTLRVVLICGTPACGKSTLARLLYGYYTKLKKPVVLIGTWPNEGSYLHYIVQHAQMHGYSLAEANLAKADMLLIFDEAQISYLYVCGYQRSRASQVVYRTLSKAVRILWANRSKHLTEYWYPVHCEDEKVDLTTNQVLCP
jgi:energy-coupling factor transporter ATP-binding protein EcfA2